jgi:peptidoglycan/LPS O-acetylase OafA/YrhL
MPATRLPALDGLRAFAILAVILLHVGFWHAGGVGVDLFFVLSGFLITGILLDAKASAATWRAYVWPFYARRALRIFPVAFAALTLAFVVAPAIGFWPAPAFREQIWFWAYLSNWHTGSRSYATMHLKHFWSLAVEEQFYSTWPLIIWWCSRRQIKRISGACVILIPIIRILVSVWHIPASDTLAAVAPTALRFDGLAAGAWLSVAARDPGGLARWRPWSWCALVTGLVIVRLTDDVSGAVIVFAAALLIALTVEPDHLYARILSLPPLGWVGRVSYVVYVVHFPIAARLLGLGFSPLNNLAVTLTVSLLIAWASWQWFEQPILALRSRWPMPASVRPRAEAVAASDRRQGPVDRRASEPVIADLRRPTAI